MVNDPQMWLLSTQLQTFVDVPQETAMLHASNRDVFLSVVDDLSPIDAGFLAYRSVHGGVFRRAHVTRARTALLFPGPVSKHLEGSLLVA